MQLTSLQPKAFLVALVLAGYVDVADCEDSNTPKCFPNSTIMDGYLSDLYRYLNSSSNAPLQLHQVFKLIIRLNNGKGNISSLPENASVCAAIKQLAESYNFGDQLSKEDFIAFCPAIIHQQLFQKCESKEEEENTPNTFGLVASISESYGYGTVAILIVSAIPIVIFICLPRKSSNTYPHAKNLLIALATSTLISDAILHLIPQALGVVLFPHKKADGTIFEISQNLLKLLAVLSAIYAMYLFSMLMGIRERVKVEGEEEEARQKVIKEKQEKQEKQSTSQSPRKEEAPVEPQRMPLARYNSSFDWVLTHDEGIKHRSTLVKSDSGIKFTNEVTFTKETDPSVIAEFRTRLATLARELVIAKKEERDEDLESNDESPKPVRTIFFQRNGRTPSIVEHDRYQDRKTTEGGNATNQSRKSSRASLLMLHMIRSITRRASSVQQRMKGAKKHVLPQKSFGWIILVSDILHNIMDGIAIGAAFSRNPVSGITTTVAVAFHEIPHEIGDFAALMVAGISWAGAMFWNGVLSVMSFVGLFIGLAVATDETAAKWVYAITAGIFMYHALSEFMPDLLGIRYPENFWIFLALQNAGILLGFTVMFLLTIFQAELFEALEKL